MVLATDPDREGEAISWHVAQELQVSCPLDFAHVQYDASEVSASHNNREESTVQCVGCMSLSVFCVSSSHHHTLSHAQRRGALTGKPVQRVTFTEVTKKAVEEALRAPREVSVHRKIFVMCACCVCAFVHTESQRRQSTRR